MVSSDNLRFADGSFINESVSDDREAGENPARSRHREVDLGIGIWDFGFVYIRDPKSQFPNGQVGIPAWELFARDMFRVKTFEAAGHF